MAIYTKTGDKGKTSLYDGTRVSKGDIRVESYGTIDELGAMLGLAKNYVKEDKMYQEIMEIQNKLFVVAANLATKEESRIKVRITEEDIKVLEDLVDYYSEKTSNMDGFIINGSDIASGHLHVARTVCRRAERRIINLASEEDVDEILIKYVNRLADTIYSMAKYCEINETRVNFEGSLF